jgi:methionine synthase I (cobalamin-dependent)/5,10-methylenetetrahydrofolate reductase
MHKIEFKDKIGTSVLVTDGSMLAMLQQRGFMETPPDIYNLKQPVVIEQIYQEFVDVGSEILQTNTLFSNKFVLERIGLPDKVYEINRKGVWLARSIARQKCYVAGVIGPTGRFLTPIGSLLHEEVRRSVLEQVVPLLDGGVDVLFLKSFIDVTELEIAIEAVRFVTKDTPLIAMKAFPEDGALLSTSFPKDVVQRVQKYDLTAFGANSTVGPQRMLSIIQSLRTENLLLSSIPDIGIPTLVDGFPIYNADPKYVADVVQKIVQNGACIVGAEGGATVEHIKAIVEKVKDTTIGSIELKVKQQKAEVVSDEIVDERSEFHKKLGNKFIATVELDIPRGLDMSSVIEGAKFLKTKGIDAVNISDGARARLRMSSIAISHLVQSETGMDCITHFACRDRNMIGLQSELLGAYAMNVKSFLAVTGDPAQIGDYPNATSVYDIDSIGLIKSMNNMNNSNDLMGNPIGKKTNFLISCAANPVADDLDREVDRLWKKCESGAILAFTQPLFDQDLLENFLKKIESIPIQIVLGVIPLRTVRHAEFLHYEVPGMTVPEWVRKKMSSAGDSTEQASKIGVEIAVDFVKKVKTSVSGIYMMPPFKRYSMAVEILEQL